MACMDAQTELLHEHVIAEHVGAVGSVHSPGPWLLLQNGVASVNCAALAGTWCKAMMHDSEDRYNQCRWHAGCMQAGYGAMLCVWHQYYLGQWLRTCSGWQAGACLCLQGALGSCVAS